MSSFAEHVAEQAAEQPVVDLAAVEQLRAEEIAEELHEDASTRAQYAAKAAKNERAQWERTETATLRKQFGRSSVNHELFELDPDVLVPLGGGKAVRLGSMTRELIAIRRDMRTDIHNDEESAFEAEMRFWFGVEDKIGGGTIDHARAVYDPDVES